MKIDSREKEIYKVTLVGTGVNVLLVVLKFFAGIVGRSSAMVADAVHSLSDLLSDVIVLVFIRIAAKPRDRSHNYGHGKFETLATVIIGLLLAAAGVTLLVKGVDSVIKSINGEALPRPEMIALIMAVISILAKEILYRYTRRIGQKLGSQAVIANAWHHRSDAISSSGTLIGIAGAMFLGEKWRILDPIAAILVSLLIIKSAYDIIKPALDELLESSLPAKDEEEILGLVKSIPGITNVHNMRTRRVGNNIAVDFHAVMDGDMTLNKAHDIASAAESAIKSRFGDGSLINIHMEPA
ncbi:MAG: cation diffusion facilitator family transporter [Muribaculaceae bacterium]|nr:cation diffusion facilitator family transporter [Muribaculaceae bacterium]